ncbi:hypothetical protein GP486_002338 [Trichoglossum hirsutum]|uniref:AAA+ ATPase domain-containing protein n=1 Tax=Trichoglossum hirsutum TaxID=265104 RepID=A0A9P8LF68_9PEZI|nr:hypothetical protein GP486_002338 [Trichoglossum hirsutum]
MAETASGIGQKCEVRVWQDRPRKDGSRQLVAKSDLGVGLDLEEDQTYAIVMKQVFDDKSALQSTTLQINSPQLLRTFREVVKSYPTIPSDFEDPFEMESPFQMLFHYWDDLDIHRRAVTDDVTRMHLGLLFEYMKAEIGYDKSLCDGMVKKNNISFKHLWTIYRPGDLQYTVENGHPWLVRLEKTAYEENAKLGKWLELHCSYTDYDGRKAGRTSEIVKIYQKLLFAAENPAIITSLPMFPRKFLKGHDDLEETLLKRGTRFLDMKGVLVRSYDGLAEYLKEPPASYYDPDMADFDGVWLAYTETGRVVIDRKTFQEENCLKEVALFSHEVDDASKPSDTPECMLCPPYVYGYSLARKDWCKFYIDNISSVQWKEKAFESLVMGESQKLVLRALVSSHTYPNNARDQTQQKGKGLVVLLHGSPGSGKTLTAECAAESCEKALLSTTIGELNKENIPWHFEMRLKGVLQYATTWKAILLLDEADVFLEAREDGGGGAVKRNAMVAGTNYYPNPRIHLALQYSPPEIQMRRRIWTQYLQAIPSPEISVDLATAIDTLVREKINGREISNTVNTARTIARFEKRKLELRDIETVLQTRREFDVAISKLRTLQAAELREGSLPLGRRQNSLIACSDEQSAWLP